jgi:hypothetical protein
VYPPPPGLPAFLTAKVGCCSKHRCVYPPPPGLPAFLTAKVGCCSKQGAHVACAHTQTNARVDVHSQTLLDAALVVAMDVVLTNQRSHLGLSKELQTKERMEGAALASWLGGVQVSVGMS